MRLEDFLEYIEFMTFFNECGLERIKELHASKLKHKQACNYFSRMQHSNNLMPKSIVIRECYKKNVDAVLGLCLHHCS